MAKMMILAVAVGLFAGCGGDDDHGAYRAALSLTPSTPTAGAEVEIEIEVTRDGKLVMPSELHLKVTKVGGTPVELSTEAHEDHHKAKHTFADAGSYRLDAEAHVADGDHEEKASAVLDVTVE